MPLLRNTLVVMAAMCTVGAGSTGRRSIAFTDLSPSLHQWLQQQQLDEQNFNRYIRKLDSSATERRSAGEGEHLIYFVLQSTQFTSEPVIEPALSAFAFFERLGHDERARLLDDAAYLPTIDRLPASVARRFHDFLAGRDAKSENERLAYFKQLVQKDAPADGLAFLYSQYTRAMRFLYLKEAGPDRVNPSSGPNHHRQRSPESVARLYRERGFSTDSRFDANFAVHVALEVLKNLSPADRLDRTLLVGPGLDLAPRTDLIDLFPPQSYQPFAVADGLLRLGVADPARLRIDCVDINETVVNYLKDVSQRKITRLFALSELADSETRRLSDEYRRYFQEFGAYVGTKSTRSATASAHKGPAVSLSNRLYSSIDISASVADRITAERLNIITERYTPSPGYDLAVVTNVFPYFNDVELALAVANIAAMLRDGGYLIHNEARPSLAMLASAQGLPAIHVKSVVVARDQRGAIHDTIWIHRKTTKDQRPRTEDQK